MRVTNVAQTVLNNIVSKMHILFGIQQFDNSQDAVIDGSVKNGTAKKPLRLNAFKVAMVFLLFIGASTGLRAQSPMGYTYTQGTGTYTALTSPTVFQSLTAVNTDGVSSALTLPFTFVYNGSVSCDRIYISNNGFITLANATTNVAPTSTTYNPVGATTGYLGAISGFGCNLISSTLSGASTEISYITLGSSGFPSNGNPYNTVKMNTNDQAYGANPNVLYVGSVIQHEIGHCIGMRHTDYFDRSISCGGSVSNEGASTVGAVLIFGTPSTATLAEGSWMLACSNGGDRSFNSNDVTGLNYLYK